MARWGRIMEPIWLLNEEWPRAFWFSYAVLALFEVWVWLRDRRGASGQDADRGSLRTLVAVIAAGLFAAFLVAYNPATAFARLTAWQAETRLAALVLIWGGLALRLWAILTLGALFRRTVHLQEGHRMITSGPYRIVRNPAYLGSLLALIGVGLGLGSWLSALVLAIAGLLGFGRRIHVEDAALTRQFGDEHAAYRKRKAALIPFVW
jgi:protein-S-isoprenylcysteine O-methyltransferase Ste14